MTDVSRSPYVFFEFQGCYIWHAVCNTDRHENDDRKDESRERRATVHCSEDEMKVPLVTRLQEEAMILRGDDYDVRAALIEEAIAEILRLQDVIDSQLTKDHTP